MPQGFLIPNVFGKLSAEADPVTSQPTKTGSAPDFDGELRLMEGLLSEMERSQMMMWEAASLVGKLYRIYLTGRENSIEAAAYYSAEEEPEAIEIASSVHGTCSDVFGGYELWRGQRRVVPMQADRPVYEEDDADIAALMKHQAVVLDVEEQLQKGFACVRRSRKLVSLAQQLKTARGA
jgi:hypothetical protein